MSVYLIILLAGFGVLVLLALSERRTPKPGLKCGKRTDLTTTEWDDMFRRHEKPLVPWRALKATAWVESRYDPCALGQSGEVGMFQIMPEWERKLGLSRDLPENNCELASRILEIERKTWFDWDKVAGAYNSGYATIRRAIDVAIRQEGDRNKWKDYLPSGVRNYVDTWIATYRLLGGQI